MAPAGVNSSVNELSGLLSTSCGPCQLPWKATTQPSGSFVVPLVRSTLVAAPSVLHHAFTPPRSWKV